MTPLDRLLTETTSLGTVTYREEPAGRRTSMTVAGQAPVSYTYDHNARLRTITQVPLTPVDIQFDAANRRTLLTLPNGVSTEYVYDLGSRLSALVYRNTLGPLGDLTSQYDAAGNRLAPGGSVARPLVPEAVASASYDAGNRPLGFGAQTVCCGWYSNVNRGKRRKAQGEHAPCIAEFREVAPSVATRAWARLIKQVDETEPLLGPRCAGPMRLIAVIEQPAGIETILRPLALWPAPAQSPPAGYPLLYSLQRVALAAESVSDPARATRAQRVGTDDAVRPGTGPRRAAVAPLVSA